MLTIIVLPSKGFRMNYGMKLKMSFLKKNHPKQLVDQLYHTEKCLMEFSTYRTGCQWKMLPKEHGSGSTCHRRFQQWNCMSVFKNIWIKLLKIYDEMIGINWTW